MCSNLNLLLSLVMSHRASLVIYAVAELSSYVGRVLGKQIKNFGNVLGSIILSTQMFVVNRS